MSMVKATIPVAKSIAFKMEKRVSRLVSELEESQFLTSDIFTVREIETDEIRRVCKTSLAFNRYPLSDSKIQELFFHMLLDCEFGASLL